MSQPKWLLLPIIWFAIISFLPDPRPLSAPAWTVGGLRSMADLSEPVARAIASISMRGIGFGLLGACLAIALTRFQTGWTYIAVLLLAPILAIGSQWINYRYFPVLPQIQLSVIASILGSLLGLALSQNIRILGAFAIATVALYVWVTATTVNADLEMATRATGLHLLAFAGDAPGGDDGFVKLTQIAFAYAEDNSHGTDAVFANRAAILALGIILGEERLAQMAVRHVSLDRIDEFVALRGRTTLRERHDLTRHFWVSAGLVILTDANRSLTVGIGKELMDSTPGGSGFSFIDMLANRAGILFANSATRDQVTARGVQRLLQTELTSADFLPHFEGLPEGLSRDEFQSEFGGLAGARTRDIDNEISRRLETASAIQVQGSASGPG